MTLPKVTALIILSAFAGLLIMAMMTYAFAHPLTLLLAFLFLAARFRH